MATRRFPRTLAATILVLAVPMAACGGKDDTKGSGKDNDSTPSASDPTTTESASGSGCDAAPPEEGAFETPVTTTSYSTGTFVIKLELSDGTTDCLEYDGPFVDLGFGIDDSWTLDDDSAALELTMGDVDAGLVMSVTDRNDDDSDDLTGLGEVEAFTGIEYDGKYFSDGFYTYCDTELLDLTTTSAAGTFSCKDLPGNPDGGPFDGAKGTDLVVTSATGWWTATA